MKIDLTQDEWEEVIESINGRLESSFISPELEKYLQDIIDKIDYHFREYKW